MKNYILSIAVLFAFSCKTNSQESAIKEVFSLEKKHKEVSGLVFHNATDLLWLLQDKGNDPVLYAYSKEGNFERTLHIQNQENTDWEDLTQDTQGNLYIGNFGNNDNNRKDLRILKIDQSSLNGKETNVSQTTNFYYEDQKAFPPKKSQLVYDCEAFVTTDDAFYLFTKNRSKGFDGTFSIYKVPNQQGTFEAKKIATFKTCDQYRTCAITGASLRPDGKEIALLTHDKVILLPLDSKDSFQQKDLIIIPLHHNTQKEAIAYYNNKSIFIADEKEKGADGGKIYSLDLP